MFNTLSPDDASKIETPITIEEIKAVVWACGSDQAPGPDRLTFKFVKTYWEIMKSDVIAFVKHFEMFGRFARGCTSSLITLIPKTKDPNLLSDYRPICLIGIMYKIVAKILAVRLKSVINNVIGEQQSGYIEGRNILDGPLMINEFHSWTKKAKKRNFFSKLTSIKHLTQSIRNI